MDITISIPDFKFAIGDVVRIPNERNDKCIYLRIRSRSAHFEVKWNREIAEVLPVCRRAIATNETWADSLGAGYDADVLPGSWTDSVEPAPLREGNISLYHSVVERGELVEDEVELWSICDGGEKGMWSIWRGIVRFWIKVWSVFVTITDLHIFHYYPHDEPPHFWFSVWLPKWHQGRGYFVSIGLWRMTIWHGY